MVKPKLTKKTTLILLTLLITVGGIFGLAMGINAINKFDAKRQKSYEDAATPIGLARAKEECLKEGLDNEVCDSITVTATTTTECGGRVCWIVHAETKDVYVFTSEVSIGLTNGKYVVFKYNRSKVTPLD